MTVLYTRWRFENYQKKDELEFDIGKKKHEKTREALFTFRLHSTKLLPF